MPHVKLIHHQQEITLSQGESVVGRALDCQVRFNDAAVSRHHVRIICGMRAVMIEDLDSSNGTRINGESLIGSRALQDQDIIEIGFRSLRVEVSDAVGPRMESYDESEPVVVSGPLEAAPGLLIPEEFGRGDADERTSPGDGPSGMLADLAFSERNCPRCRSLVASSSDLCQTCGYMWPLGRPAATTQEIDVAALMRRSSERYVVEVPIIYSSEHLTIDAIARDISEGGMFIDSELLDPVGTACKITALPDGRGAIHFDCAVAHVRSRAVNGRPAGFGVQFVDVSKSANEWLRLCLSRATGTIDP